VLWPLRGWQQQKCQSKLQDNYKTTVATAETGFACCLKRRHWYAHLDRLDLPAAATSTVTDLARFSADPASQPGGRRWIRRAVAEDNLENRRYSSELAGTKST